MDESQLDAEIAALQAELAEQNSIIAQLQGQARPAPERFIENLSPREMGANTLQTGKQLLGAIPQLAGAAVSAGANELFEDPGTALMTGGASLITDPIVNAVSDYYARTPPKQAVVETLKNVAGIVPFGSYAAEIADEFRKGGGWSRGVDALPSAEKAAQMLNKQAGPELLALAAGGLAKGAVKTSDRFLGVAPDRVGKIAEAASDADRVLAGQFNPLNSRTGTGIQQTVDAVDVMPTIKEELGEKILNTPTNPAGYKALQGEVEAARLAAGQSREELLKNLDVTLAKEQQVKGVKYGMWDEDLNKVKSNDFDFSIVDESSMNLGPNGQVSANMLREKFLDPIQNNPEGLSFSDLQNKIKEIDANVRELNGYDDATRANTVTLQNRSPDKEIQLLGLYRNAYQTALKNKMTWLEGFGALPPGTKTAYEKSNAMVKAGHEIEPLMTRFQAETVASHQGEPPRASLNNAVMSAKQGIASEITNPTTKAIARGVEREGDRLRIMQSVLNPDRMSLLSRSFEFMKTSTLQNAAVAQMAFEIGAIADPRQWRSLPTPQRKGIFDQVVSIFADQFEPSASGLPSEVDGKLMDPFDQDYYAQEQYERYANDPSARADVLGPFLSQRKVVDPGTVGGVKQTELPEFNALELYPQLDGGFGLESTLDMGAKKQQAENVSLEESLRALRDGYQ